MLCPGHSSKQTKDTSKSNWRPVQRAAAVSPPRGGICQKHSDSLPYLQVGLALLLMCCGLELKYVWLRFVILPVCQAPFLAGSSFRWETCGKGASSHSLLWSGALGFLSGDLLIQLVPGSEIFCTACQALRAPLCCVLIKIVVGHFPFLGL